MGRGATIGSTGRVFAMLGLAWTLFGATAAAWAQNTIPLEAVVVQPGRSICSGSVRVERVITVETWVATPMPIAAPPILTVTSTPLGFAPSPNQLRPPVILQTPLPAGPTSPRAFFRIDQAIFPDLARGFAMACVMNPPMNPGPINLILVVRGDGVGI